MPVRYRPLLAALFASVFLMGCASSKPYYASPDVTDRYQASEQSTLLIDMMLAEDIAGRQDLIDVPRNRSFGQTLADSARAQLDRKGFAVSAVLPAAVGQLVQPVEPHRVVHTEAEREWDRNALSAASAPFYVDAAWADRLDAEALAQIPMPQRGETYAPDLDAGPVPDATETFVLVTTRGRSVGAGQQIGQGLLTSVVTSILTMGMVSVTAYERSYVQVALYLIEPDTKRVLWADAKEVGGIGRVDLDDITDTLADLTKKLPDARQVQAAQ